MIALMYPFLSTHSTARTEHVTETHDSLKEGTAVVLIESRAIVGGGQTQRKGEGVAGRERVWRGGSRVDGLTMSCCGRIWSHIAMRLSCRSLLVTVLGRV